MKREAREASELQAKREAREAPELHRLQALGEAREAPELHRLQASGKAFKVSVGSVVLLQDLDKEIQGVCPLVVISPQH